MIDFKARSMMLFYGFFFGAVYTIFMILTNE